MAWESGDLQAAETGIKRELQVLRELQERDTGPDLKRDLADTVSWLGSIALRQGDLAAAGEYLKRSAESLRLLSLAEPDSTTRKYDWASAIQLVVNVALLTGDLSGAETLTNQAMAIFDELAAQDEDNRVWVRSSSEGWILKGKLLAARGEFENARNYAARAVSLLRTLVEEEASDLASQEVLADAYYLTAWIDVSTGDVAAALDSNQNALENMQLLQRAGHLNDKRLGKLASVMVSQGQLHQSLGQYDQSQGFWQQAREMLAEKAATVSTPLLLDPWARVLMLSGQIDEAENIIKKLETNLYRPLRPWPKTAG